MAHRLTFTAAAALLGLACAEDGEPGPGALTGVGGGAGSERAGAGGAVDAGAASGGRAGNAGRGSGGRATGATGGAGGRAGAAGAASGGRTASGGAGAAGRESSAGGRAAGEGGAGGQAGDLPLACTEPVFTTSDTNGGWSTGGYYVHNNVWNAAEAGPETLYACSYHDWYVTSTQPDTTSVKAYPNVHVDIANLDGLPVENYARIVSTLYSSSALANASSSSRFSSSRCLARS